jgi:hypothetical protein
LRAADRNSGVSTTLIGVASVMTECSPLDESIQGRIERMRTSSLPR